MLLKEEESKLKYRINNTNSTKAMSKNPSFCLEYTQIRSQSTGRTELKVWPHSVIYLENREQGLSAIRVSIQLLNGNANDLMSRRNKNLSNI
jgi:hypothetical protein